ncbi:hypothetical protein CkaCkLH20_07598 [Colletotrichum karsti]|uniref:Fe2OG dioxygenase domain-containing protein n=1 Tax=Colletotrichum karsti TaxID=1095194 RepID=A0A9P6LG74_9PEZI|nr:uncharacterized protein CkaCkLH20_07598 [Colletotrichum karsti]KAF9874904.1 hypothetical protein CkaCkLH20_07598 [Colletotrichum karsti]
MRSEIEDFKHTSHQLGVKLLQIFARHFGLENDYFSKAHDDLEGPGSALRMLHYPVLPEQPDKSVPRLYEHTDWGSLTFVWPQSGGLEIETPSKQWIPVPLVPGGVVVNIGDCLSLWSGKVLKSTLHKINFDALPIDQERWSMAYFVNANNDAKLEVLSSEARSASVQDFSEVLTMHHYAQARIYMSQALDAKNNWLASDTRDLKPIMKVVDVIEQLGIANGNGALNVMKSVAA